MGDQRLSHIESLVADTAGMKMTEFAKDMDQRFALLQEDQKRSRDVLESSFHEQLRLEHSAREAQGLQVKEVWERELKSRQAYQENYKELLAQERSAREAAEH